MNRAATTLLLVAMTVGLAQAQRGGGPPGGGPPGPPPGMGGGGAAPAAPGGGFSNPAPPGPGAPTGAAAANRGLSTPAPNSTAGRGSGPDTALQLGLPLGRWWDEAPTAQKLGLTPRQVTQMDGVFASNWPHLREAQATLDQEEARIAPLLAAPEVDERKVQQQIDRVVAARAELERANARMLLELRRQMTAEQWLKLQNSHPAVTGGREPESEDN